MLSNISKKIPQTISPEAQKVLRELIESFDPNLKYPEPDDFVHWEIIQKELENSKVGLNKKVAREFGIKSIEKEIEDAFF